MALTAAAEIHKMIHLLSFPQRERIPSNVNTVEASGGQAVKCLHPCGAIQVAETLVCPTLPQPPSC